MKRLITSLALALIYFSATVQAQTFRGSIAGSVADSSGAAVAGANIKIENTGTGLKRETVATGAGEYVFQDLPLGIYQVTITAPGFDTTRVDKVNVEVGQVVNLPVKLGVASQASLVEVSAAGVALETSNSTINSVIPTRAVQDIPLNGRDFTQLVKLSPGVNGAGSINGTRTAQNNWQIDGTDNNDLWHNSVAVNQGGVSGVAGALLPIDAIDQFSVSTNGTAEYGRNGGGSVNMVIKSGTNGLHGTLYYFNRNDALAVTPPFVSQKPKLKNNQFGGSVGGPVIKNKLFYFATYERQKFVVGNSTPATEPSAAYVALATTVLNRYQIPVNVVSTNLLSFWPARGRTGPASNNNFQSTDNSDNFSDNFVGKIDYILNAKNNLAFRYSGGTGTQTAPVGSPYHEYYQVAPSRIHNFSLVYNSVLSSKMVNQVLAGVNYFKQTFGDFDNSPNPVAAGLNTGVTNPSLSGSPDITINGFDEIGLTPPLGRIDTTGHITDTFSYTTGKHQFRMGFEYRRSRADVFYQRNKRGVFAFDGSQGPWAKDATITDPNVKSLADFLGGYAASGLIVQGSLQRDYYQNGYEGFAQDSYQFSQKLTFNVGVRYTDYRAFYDKTNRISAFRPDQGGLVFTSDGKPLYDAPSNDFAPRFGFAYQAKPKLVIRGGYGLFFDVPNLNAIADNRPPNGGASGVLANPGGPDPVYTLNRSNFVIVNGQPIFGANNIPSPPYGAFSIQKNFKSAYVENYNLNVQYELGRGAVFQLGYVGSVSHHLLVVRDINQAANSPLGSANTRALAQLTRPYNSTFPTFSAINEVQTIGNSNYNSLQASLRTNGWHGVASQFSYTYGHSLDDASAIRGASPRNSNDVRGDYGNSDFDVRHTFNSYVTYDLPHSSVGPKLLVNGWQLNSLLSFHTGQPFNVTYGQNVSGAFEGKDRVNLVGDPFAGVNQDLQNKSVQWFSKSAFAVPANGTFGNLSRNRFYGPGFGSVDFSVFKNTKINERISTQFRVEIFNLFNRVNLSGPTATYTSGRFGTITDTVGDANGAPGIGPGEPRNVQLALKVIF